MNYLKIANILLGGALLLGGWAWSRPLTAAGTSLSN